MIIKCILKSRAGGGQNLGKESTFEKSELCFANIKIIFMSCFPN